MEFVGKKVTLYFDSQRQGYDGAMWTTLTGTPNINGSNNVEFNAASAIGRADFGRGEFDYFLTVPFAPTSGDAREWGLLQANTTCKVTFKVTGAVFTAQSSDIDGNVNSATIIWEAGWTAASTQFKIQYTPGNAVFFINEEKVAELNGSGVPNGPMSWYISNTNADTLQLSHIQVRDADLYSAGSLTSGATGTSNGVVTPSSIQTPYTSYVNDSFQAAVAKAAPGHVYSISAENVSGATRWIQIFDDVAAPGSTETPIYKYEIPATSGQVQIGIDIFGPAGLWCSTGIVVANSSTSTTYTAGTAGDVLLNMMYDGASGSGGTTYLLLENDGEILLETGDIMLQE